MRCSGGHEMEIVNVEVSAAHQSGGDIVDAEYRDMYMCHFCDEFEPINYKEEE